MKSIRNTLIFLLAAVFIYSAIGQPIVLHYCNMGLKEKNCSEKEACCQEENPGCEESNSSTTTPLLNRDAACCFTMSQYLVNPFSVRTPDHKIGISIATQPLIAIQKIQPAATPVKLFSSVPAECSPPGRTILLLKNILVI